MNSSPVTEALAIQRVRRDHTYDTPHLRYGLLVSISGFSAAELRPVQSSAAYAAPALQRPPRERGKALRTVTLSFWGYCSPSPLPRLRVSSSCLGGFLWKTNTAATPFLFHPHFLTTPPEFCSPDAPMLLD